MIYTRSLHVKLSSMVYTRSLPIKLHIKPGRNTFKLFYVYVHLKNCMFYICVQINASESESNIKLSNMVYTRSLYIKLSDMV